MTSVDQINKTVAHKTKRGTKKKAEKHHRTAWNDELVIILHGDINKSDAFHIKIKVN